MEIQTGVTDTVLHLAFLHDMACFQSSELSHSAVWVLMCSLDTGVQSPRSPTVPSKVVKP
eukprot:2908109-Prymnesium_polylepis.1